jgi:hypothetical protein
VSSAKAESGKDEGSEGHRIDRGEDGSGSDGSTLLENQCKINIVKLALKKEDQNKSGYANC